MKVIEQFVGMTSTRRPIVSRGDYLHKGQLEDRHVDGFL